MPRKPTKHRTKRVKDKDNHQSSYLFDPFRHVRIWISTNPDTFLNLENRIRLTHMRRHDPRLVISFFYAKKLLNESALKKMNAFCTKFRITPRSLEDDVLPHLETTIEKRIGVLINMEVNALNQGGSAAAISDMMRILPPVIKHGAYMDFDTTLKTNHLSDEPIPVLSPHLIASGSNRGQNIS